MKPARLAAGALIAAMFYAGAPRAESIMQALDALGETANSVNSSILDRFGDQEGAAGYQADIARYKRLEAGRVREFAAVSGVSPQVIRQLRQSGQTWEQIAAKYGVNLNSLPPPREAGAGN